MNFNKRDYITALMDVNSIITALMAQSNFYKHEDIPLEDKRAYISGIEFAYQDVKSNVDKLYGKISGKDIPLDTVRAITTNINLLPPSVCFIMIAINLIAISVLFIVLFKYLVA